VTKTLDLARRASVSRPELNLANVALSETVEEFLELMRFVITEHSLHIDNRIGQDIVVRADRKELEELFYNLISNVIKFSPTETDVIIEAEQRHGQVSVAVKDKGIGLSPEERTLIFDEFYKADSSRHELGSSGLGLAICRQIIENHGGRIWAESDGKGLGTSICFTLAAGGTA
jgi:signal transduction histidine kinase